MDKQRIISLCLLLGSITLALYLPGLSFDFIKYDDLNYVTQNPHVQNGLTWQSVTWAFQNSYADNWHPLTWLSHMLDWQLYGARPWGHHLTNILFHSANSVLWFLVLVFMTGALWRSFFVAALFAWHPLHVESVAWIAERKDVLSAFFWILTLGTYAKYAQTPKPRWYLLTLNLFILGLLSKPMVVSLPFVLLLLDFWPLKRIAAYGSRQMTEQGGVWSAELKEGSGESFEHSKSSVQDRMESNPTVGWRRVLWEKIPFFALSLASSIVTIWAQQKGHAIMPAEIMPLDVRLANALIAYVKYIGKMFWPDNLAVFYPYLGPAAFWQLALAFLLLAGVSVLAILNARRFPWLPVGWFWFLGTLVPVIGIVQVGSQSMADRYTYIPYQGLSLVLAWGAAAVCASRKTLLPRWCQLGTAVLLAGCLLAAHVQLRYWKNTQLLFDHARAVTKQNYVACYFLGIEQAQAGKNEEAIPWFKLALDYFPSSADARYALGSTLLALHQYDQAIASFREAARLNPRLAGLYNGWGSALNQKGEYAEAEAKYRKELERDPNYLFANLNLGIVLLHQNKLDEAIGALNKTLSLRSDLVPARVCLGDALLGQARPEEAAGHYLAALQLAPNNLHALKALAQAFNQAGRNNDALGSLLKAAQIDPADPAIQYELGATYVFLNNPANAINCYQAALQIKPDYPEALNNLAWIRAANENQQFRNGSEAVQLAKRACDLTKNEQPLSLGTLAAAYAEAGDFPQAIATAAKARDLALAKNRKDVAAKNQELLQLYEAGKPYHEAAKPAGGTTP